MGSDTEMISFDNQADPNRTTTNIDSCGYVSTVRVRYAEMSPKAQRRNKLIEFLLIAKLSVILVTMILHSLGLYAGGLNDQITKRELLTNRSIRSARGRWAARVQGWTAYRNWWHVIVCNKFCVTLLSVMWQQLVCDRKRISVALLV